MAIERRGINVEFEHQKLRRGKLWLLKSVTMAVALSVGVILIETGLWVLAPVHYHEWMLWIPDGHIQGRAAPHQVFHTRDGYEVRINSLGFRGPEYDWKPAAGTLRLAAFGGSSTFCYHAHGEESTWPGRLQRALSEALHMPVEVINLGLPGFDADNSKINYLYIGRALQPHVVLEYDTWNDMKSFRMLARRPIRFAGVASNKPLWQEIARATQIGRHVRNLLYEMELLKTENYYTSLEKEGVEANQPVVPAALQWARRNYHDFASFALSDGVLPVLISQATIVAPVNFKKREYREQMNEDLVGMTIPILYKTWIELNGIIEDVAREKSAIFVDGYNAVPHDFKHLEDSIHLTDEGANVLARAIAETLLRDARFLGIVKRVRNVSGPRTPPASVSAGPRQAYRFS